MVHPSNQNLRPKVRKANVSCDERIENLKSCLRQAYKATAGESRKAQQTNKRLYNKRAKWRTFEPGDFVYLFCPARKPGLSRKFNYPWKGLFEVTAKLSDLNYEIRADNGKKMIVHVNRLKAAHAAASKQLAPPIRRKQAGKTRAVDSASAHEELEDILEIPSRPLAVAEREPHSAPPASLPRSPLPLSQLDYQHDRRQMTLRLNQVIVHYREGN
jgi:hypothetical protein